MRRVLVTAGTLAITACGDRPAAPPVDAIPLFDNLGTFHVPISTKVPGAQAYFDQGMRLAYAFNHADAVRSFTEAARLDPRCAICQWGVAYALGPNINAPMDSAAALKAWDALAAANRLSANANERERDFISAMAARYVEHPIATRAGLDSAYATAMAGLVGKYPNDLEAATLHAEARMNLRPWDYWEGIGKPRPGTEILVAELERALAADSTHPGACHFYIHAVEATEPIRAVACAERLAAAMPGAGHLVHMPSHVYVRVGRYADAIEINHHAAGADSSLSATERLSPAYATLYVPHNYHFLGFAALMAGRADLAKEAARRTVETMPVAGAKGMPEYQPLLAFEHSVHLKFGDWAKVLDLPLPDTALPIGRAVAEYARGVALAATGRVAEAEALAPVIAARGEGKWSPVAAGIVAIAHHSLLGEIAARQKKWPDAIRHFEAAVVVEDQLGYMEPPWWVEPVRQALGGALAKSGRHRDAERVYREDLARFPGNLWSLTGLDASLRAQLKPDRAVAEELAKARAYAGERHSATDH